MEEHSGSSFANSCIKMPIDPFSRQPTPSYERSATINKNFNQEKSDTISKVDENTTPNDLLMETCSPESIHEFLDFLESIPDYGEVHHLSNEQFKQKLNYLKRKQIMFLTNLRSCLDGRKDDEEKEEEILNGQSENIKIHGNKRMLKKEKRRSRNKVRQRYFGENNKLNLKGKKCNVEESGINSPLRYRRGSFKDLTKNQDLLSYSSKITNKAKKTLRNRDILSSSRSWSDASDGLKNNRCIESDPEFCTETKSLPPHSPQKWNQTLSETFEFNLREDAEKCLSQAEYQFKKLSNQCVKKKGGSKKKRVRKIPKSSKLPLYDKLLADKEERSRIVREESAINLLSQVRPFKLECEQRALRSISRSTPELCTRKFNSSLEFKAKPVPKNLFNTDIYDKMLEDEYFRYLQKKIRAIELLRSSSLPPSMARRQKMESSSLNSHDNTPKDSTSEKSRRTRRSQCTSSSSSDRRKSSVMTRTNNGTNLAAILRCQASREKLEREIEEEIAEKERIQNEKVRQTLLARKPAWKALRIAARYDHDRELNYRTKLRRNEAREQAERHRLQMELMLDRVMRIPTLFERFSQNFQLYSQCIAEIHAARKGMNTKKPESSSAESYASLGSSSTSSLRINTISSISSPRTLTSSSNHSSNSSKSSKSFDTIPKSVKLTPNTRNIKKKNDRGTLKVSINENAELIEDKFGNNSVINESQTNNELESKNNE